jgi:hypothetical protein
MRSEEPFVAAAGPHDFAQRFEQLLRSYSMELSRVAMLAE